MRFLNAVMYVSLYLNVYAYVLMPASSYSRWEVVMLFGRFVGRSDFMYV